MSTELEAPVQLFDFDINGPPPALPFPSRSGVDAVILPKWIYITDRSGHLYLTERSGHPKATITFRPGNPDLDCAFETIQRAPSRYRLVARNRDYIVRYGNSWYSSYGESAGSFHIITTTGNKVYLKDNYNPTRFFSTELRSTGAPLAFDYIHDSCLVQIIQAAVKNEITDIQYDIAGAKVVELAPIVALSTTVRNDTYNDTTQTIAYSYERWKDGTWNNTAGIDIGQDICFKAGVPFVSNAEFDISVSPPSWHKWGGEEGVKETVNTSVTITIPPKKKARVIIIVKNIQINVGFTYMQKVLWVNGENDVEKKNGMYQNVDSWHVGVVLDNWEDI